MARFVVQAFTDVGGQQVGLYDSDIRLAPSQPMLVRSYSSQAAASAAATLNSTRGTGLSELIALFPLAGALPVTIGNTAGGSITISIDAPSLALPGPDDLLTPAPGEQAA